jgi:hypothetical protein
MIISGKYDKITPKKLINSWVNANKLFNREPIKIINIPSGEHGLSQSDFIFIRQKKINFLKSLMSQ